MQKVNNSFEEDDLEINNHSENILQYFTSPVSMKYFKQTYADHVESIKQKIPVFRALQNASKSKTKTQRCPDLISPTKSQIKRPKVVDYIIKLSKQLNLSQTTMIYSIEIYDYFMLKSREQGRQVIDNQGIFYLTGMACLYIANKLQRSQSSLTSQQFRQRIADLKYPRSYLTNAQTDVLVTINFRCHLSILKPLLKIFIGKMAIQVEEEEISDTKSNFMQYDDVQRSLNVRHGLILKKIEEIATALLLQCLYVERLYRLQAELLIAGVICCSFRSFRHNCNGISKVQSKTIVKDYKRVGKIALISQENLTKCENLIKSEIEMMIKQNPELDQAQNLFKSIIKQIKEHGI